MPDAWWLGPGQTQRSATDDETQWDSPQPPPASALPRSSGDEPAHLPPRFTLVQATQPEPPSPSPKAAAIASPASGVVTADSPAAPTPVVAATPVDAGVVRASPDVPAAGEAAPPPG